MRLGRGIEMFLMFWGMLENGCRICFFRGCEDVCLTEVRECREWVINAHVIVC
jgi:hypothetical protein